MEENLKQKLDSVREGIPGIFSRSIKARLTWELARAAEKGIDLRSVYGVYEAFSKSGEGVTPGITLPAQNLGEIFYVPQPMINYYIEGENFTRGLGLLTGDDVNSLGLNVQDDEKDLVQRVLRVNMTPSQQIDAIMKNPSFRNDVLNYSLLLLKSCRLNREITRRILEKKSPNRRGWLEAEKLGVQLIEFYAQEMGVEFSLSDLMKRIPETIKDSYRHGYGITFEN